MPGWSCHAKPFEYCVGYLRVARFQQELLERRLPPLLPRFNSRPQLKNAGDPVSALHDDVQEGIREWRWVLKFEGHMLVYDPQTNGAGWGSDEGSPLITHRGRITIHKWLGKLLSQPICSAQSSPRATQSPRGKPAVEYEQMEAQPLESHGNGLR